MTLASLSIVVKKNFYPCRGLRPLWLWWVYNFEGWDTVCWKKKPLRWKKKHIALRKNTVFKIIKVNHKSLVITWLLHHSLYSFIVPNFLPPISINTFAWNKVTQSLRFYISKYQSNYLPGPTARCSGVQALIKFQVQQQDVVGFRH